MCAKKERHKPLDLMLRWLEIQACSSSFNIILSASPTAFPAITSITVFFLSFLIKRLLLEYSWKLSISRRWWRASCHFLTASQTVKNEVAHSHPCCPHAANSIPKSNKKGCIPASSLSAHSATEELLAYGTIIWDHKSFKYTSWYITVYMQSSTSYMCVRGNRNCHLYSKGKS